jgi:hypothetical protein
MDHTPYVSAFNLRKLAGSLLVLLIALALAGGVVFGLRHYCSQAEQGMRQAQAELADSRNRLMRLQQDEQDILARIERYRALVAGGRIQPERRLDWVDSLRRIREQRRLLSLDYEIAPQRLLDASQAASGGHQFYVSPMKLDMLLLHEHDLLGLLADLQTRVAALVTVRQCTLERLATAPGTPLAAQLRAHCEIDWITLQEES